ncbi:MAG: LysR family transcriptional regulator [Nannocystaceae bacterium]|nr:LysR family transcriptional regulator [Nannocystaceae bacterium]
MDLDDLRLFAAVAEHGSYAKAAEQTGVGRSTLTRIVQRLEVECGVSLLHRTTRQVGVTASGAALLRRIQPGLADLHAAVRDFSSQTGEPAGLLRVTTSTDIAVTVLAPVVARLTRRYAKLRIETVLTLRAVDLVDEGVDLALRVYRRAPGDPSLSGRRVSEIGFGWYAAPEYLAREGTPQEEADLSQHTVVAVSATYGDATIVVDDSFFAVAAVRAGAGVGLLPRGLCAEAVTAGELVRVLPDVSVLEGQLWVVYPRGKVSPNVAAFRDALMETTRR